MEHYGPSVALVTAVNDMQARTPRVRRFQRICNGQGANSIGGFVISGPVKACRHVGDGLTVKQALPVQFGNQDSGE